MTDHQNRRIVLASRPEGEPRPQDFRLETAPVPHPGMERCCSGLGGCHSTPICAAG
jgi:NADPH-dependent curcumin reductase CurA